jgi:hypothetical protein
MGPSAPGFAVPLDQRWPVLRRLGARQATATFAADQVVNSVTNLLVIVLAARLSTASAFGAFSVAYGIVIIAFSLRSATLGDVVLVTHGRDPEAPAAGAGCSVYLGVVTAFVASSTASILGLSHSVVLAIAAASVGVLLQDSMRSAAFALRRPELALILDLILLVVQLGGSAIWWSTSSAMVLSWAAGAVTSGLVGAAVLRPRLNPLVCWRWSLSHARLLGPYAAQYALTNGVTQLFTVFVAAVGRVSDAGALRGAQTLLGPYTVCLTADRVDMLTRVRHAATMRQLTSRELKSRLGLTFLGAAVVALVLATPDRYGQHVLGASWHGAQMICPYVGVQFVLIGLAQAPQVRLVAALLATPSMLIKAVTAACSLVGFAVALVAGVEPLRAAVFALVASACVNLVATEWAARVLAPLADIAVSE